MALSKPGKIAAWTAGTALTVVLVVLALRLDDSTPPAATGPLLTAAFDDGGELEVIGISVGERLIEMNPPKRFAIPFFTITGSSGGIWSGLNVNIEEKNGQVVRARVHSEDAPRALLMEFRLKERNGSAMTLPNHLMDRDWVEQDNRLVPGSAPSTEFNPQDDHVETLRKAMEQAGLQVLIQHRDPQSGWIHLMGPSMYYEGWPDRYIVRLTAWNRSLPTLDFRAIRADGQVAEFSLPNPDLKKTPSSITPATLPIVHTAGDYTLTVRNVRRFAMPGKHPFVTVESDLHFNGAPVPGLKDGPLEYELLDVTDEWGNVMKARRWQDHHEASIPAASKRFSFNLRVNRTQDYPRLASDGYLVLVGVVNSMGTAVDFTPGPDAALFGIRNMPVSRIRTTKPGWRRDEPKDWLALEFKIEGESSSSNLNTIESRIGKIDHWQFLFFPRESAESTGLSDHDNIGGRGTSLGSFNFNRKLNHLFPPDLLQPGAKLRVGVHAPMPSDNLSFELELPEQAEER